jgi:hypothetical protein
MDVRSGTPMFLVKILMDMEQSVPFTKSG